jgi:hypothetical protein
MPDEPLIHSLPLAGSNAGSAVAKADAVGVPVPCRIVILFCRGMGQ